MADEKSTKQTEKITRSGHHRLGFWLSVVTAILVVLGMVILTLLPFAMEWGAEHVFVRLGAKAANVSDIDFNPMTGRLKVFDLQVEGPNGDKVSMEQLVIKVDLFPIVKKRVHFREVSLTGFSMDIRQLDDNSIVFAGLSIPESQEAEGSQPEVEDEKTPWGIGLRNLDVKEFSLHIIAPDLDETVVLHHFSLTDFESWTPEKHGDHVVRVGLLGGTIDVEGTVQPFSDPMVVSTRIGIRELSLEQILPYLEDTPLKSLSGSLSGRGQVNVTFSTQSHPNLASSVRFNVFSTDMDMHVAQEGLGIELQPGTLNIGMSLDSNMDLGDSPSKKAEFTAATSLEGTTSSVTSSGASLEILQDTFSVEVSGSYSDTGSVDLSKLSAKAGLSLRGLTFKNGDGQAELMRLGSFEIEGVEINGTDDIRASLTRAGDIVLFPRLPVSIRKEEPGQALLLKSFEATGISLSDNSQLTVEAVQMDSLTAWVLREKDGDLEALKVLKELMPEAGQTAPGETSDDPEVEAPQTETAFVMDLEKFTLSGDNSLVFRDLAVDPPFNFVVDSMKASILNVSTRKIVSPTDVTLYTGMGKYSAVSVNGTLQPPWDFPDVDMHVELKAIDLPPLTPYTTKYLGYILRSGHLDTDVDLKITKGVLNSKADIVVNRIEMDAVKEEDEQRADERLGIPVKTALSLLKDKNDDIKLILPVEGDTKDPEFKISDIVVSATGLALKKGVTAYYQDLGATLLTGGLIPPGTFGILGKLFSGVTTMTFEPVVFDPMARELSEPNKAYLDLMAEKLVDKPKVRLVLCGKVTMEDIAALRQADYEASLTQTQASAGASTVTPDDSENVSEDGPGEPLTVVSTADFAGTLPEAVFSEGPPSIENVPLSADEKERLIEIAKQRALAVKDYLVEVGGLDPERMFVCYSDAETEKKELPPRVDLSI